MNYKAAWEKLMLESYDVLKSASKRGIKDSTLEGYANTLYWMIDQEVRTRGIDLQERRKTADNVFAAVSYEDVIALYEEFYLGL